MARQYVRNRGQQIGNRFVGTLVRLGLGPKGTYLMTVPGRKTGKRYTTPVTLVEDGTQRWLVAPYGPVSWVRNARAAGRVTLPGAPFRMLGTPAELRRAPLLGEHNGAVLTGRLGYSAEDVSRLRQLGVI